jgi:hypothetical protein
MLLARNFSSNKSINNAVESSLQFSWIWVELEVLCEAQSTREVKSLNPSSSGTGNLALETVPW